MCPRAHERSAMMVKVHYNIDDFLLGSLGYAKFKKYHEFIFRPDTEDIEHRVISGQGEVVRQTIYKMDDQLDPEDEEELLPHDAMVQEFVGRRAEHGLAADGPATARHSRPTPGRSAAEFRIKTVQIDGVDDIRPGPPVYFDQWSYVCVCVLQGRRVLGFQDPVLYNPFL